jgi:ATP-binding cassette subfamily F protein 3
MRILAGTEPMTAGTRIVGHNVRLGYFAQDLAEGLDYRRTVFEELSDGAEGMTTGEIRGLLGAMLFSGDDANKRVGVLSGGERARLALAKVLAHRNNCLLLDEPTNNLDIIAKDTLLEALRRFAGTVVIVSHDRHILNALVTEVIEVGRGHAIRYLGNYDEYLAKKLRLEASAVPASADGRPAPKVAAAADAPPRDGVRNNSARRGSDDQTRKRNSRKREALEAEIEKKETERAALAEQMNDPDFYLKRKDANEMIARYDLLGREVEAMYAELVKFDDAGAVRG